MAREALIRHRLIMSGWFFFPVKQNAKTPACKSWVSDSSDDAAYVAGLLQGSLNVGIDCGKSGLVVVDVDMHGIDGRSEFLNLCNKYNGGDFPNTYTVNTPSNGLHFYFVNTANLGNATGNLPDSIDIRGRGGYVLAPGSQIDGKRYTVSNATEPTPMPTWLLGLISGPTRSMGASPQQSAYSEVEQCRLEPKAHMLRRLTDELMRLCDTTAGRNNALYRTACRFGAAVAAKFDRGEAVRLLIQAAEYNGYSAKDGPQAVMDTIGSAFRRYGVEVQ